MRPALILIAALAAGPAVAETPAAIPVTVVVTIPTPPGVTRARIEAGIKAAVPQYAKLPGLIRKYFTVNDTGFGGVYLFRSRAAAEAWFNPAWHARVKSSYGTEGDVRYFDVPVITDGPENREVKRR